MYNQAYYPGTVDKVKGHGFTIPVCYVEYVGLFDGIHAYILKKIKTTLVFVSVRYLAKGKGIYGI